MFEWCSSAVMTTSSPSPTRCRPKVWATRLIASVVPRTNTISRGLGGIDERADLLARLLVGVGRLDRERVHAAVDVRVGPPIHVGDRLDDGLRLLRRRRVVEVDERVAVNRAREDREVAAERLDVEGRAAPSGRLANREDGAHTRAPRIASASARGSRRPSCASTNARSGATRILEATSLAKA